MKKSKVFVNLAKIIFSIVLVGVLFTKFNIYEFVQMINQLSVLVILISILIYIFSVFMNAFKWKIILFQYSFKKLTKVCFKSQFFSIILPGQLFGEVYKVGGIGKENKGEIATSVIMDKVTGLLGAAIVGLFGILFCSLDIPFLITSCFLIVFLLLIILLFSFKISFLCGVVNHLIGKFKNHKFAPFGIIAGVIAKLFLTWTALLDKPNILAKSILAGILNQYVGVFQVFVLARSLNITIGFMDYCWIMASVSLILLIPVSFAGIGLRDVSLIGFLSLYGVTPEKSVMISVALLISQIVSALVGGMVIVVENLMREKFETKK